MKEIRIHGRGGQGSLVLAQFMAIAALEDGKYGQAFPFLGGGGERRGKPIVAFCRLSDQTIRLRSRVNEPDYVIVQDTTILDELDVAEGLKDGGMILVNTAKDVAEDGDLDTSLSERAEDLKDSLKDMTVKELKAQLKEKGPSLDGKKADLIERLLTAGDDE